MNLDSVSYADLVKELERRKAFNQRPSSNSDDGIMGIIEPPTKVNQQAVLDEQKKQRDEEIQRLKEELEFKEMENQVLQRQLAIEKVAERMHEEHVALGNKVMAFQEECHRRNQATMTTERLSLFNW